MGVFSANDTATSGWSFRSQGGDVTIILSEPEVARADLGPIEDLTFTPSYVMLAADAPVTGETIRGGKLVVLEVDPARPASLARLESFRRSFSSIPVIAAVRDASVPLVRALLKAGVRDVIALPLARHELAATVEDVKRELAQETVSEVGQGRVVAMMKSVGGVGATSILVQMAALLARRERGSGRGVCVIDLDLQFGNVATYLGLNPMNHIGELLSAGERLDEALLRSVATEHGSGVSVIAAPKQLSPIESVDVDQVLRVIDLATRCYDVVLLDLPGNWTNWSLSLAARADLLLMVVELSVGSLRQARRQIDLLLDQQLGNIPLEVIVNRVEKKLFKSIDLSDVRRVLGQDVDLVVANDFQLMSAACDQGVLVGDLRAKTKIDRDLGAIAARCDELLQKERGNVED